MKLRLLIFLAAIFFNCLLLSAQDLGEYSVYDDSHNIKVIPIDLTTVLKLAGSDNLSIKAAQAAKELAEARSVSAGQYLLPNFNLGAHFMQHSGIAQNTDGTFIDTNKNSLFAGLGVRVDWRFGDAVYERLAARQQVLAAGFRLKAERNRQILEAVKAYYDLTAAQVKLVTLDVMTKKTEDISQQLSVMVDQGLRYKSDLLLAQTALNLIRISYNQAKVTLGTKSNALLNALNIQDNAFLLSADTTLVPIQLVDSALILQFDAAYQKRPELQELSFNIKTLEFKRKAFTSGLLFPDVSAGVNDGLFGPAFSPEGNRFLFYAGLRWNIPLGELFSNGNKKQYNAMIRMEKIRMDATRNLIRRDIQDAYTLLALNKQNNRHAEEGVQLAKKALQQSIQRQKMGTALPLEVFVAQEKLIDAELKLIDAITEFNKAQYSLLVAMGNDL